MKLQASILTQRAEIVLPAAHTTTGSRPVRRGSFWPGENFKAYTNKWDLTGAFARQALILPTLGGSKGSRTL